jgi:hypothetical protein
MSASLVRFTGRETAYELTKSLRSSPVIAALWSSLAFLPLGAAGHCQSKLVYFAKTSEPDFAAIDFPAFFRVNLSGSMAAASI